jgi:hypothetical protein
VTSRQYRLGIGPRQSTRERFRASGRRSRAPSTSRTLDAALLRSPLVEGPARRPLREGPGRSTLEAAFAAPLRRTSPDPAFSFWRRT